jgi:hypothetical protein
MTEAELKALYEELLAEGAHDGRDRPDPEEIVAALEGENTEEERLRILDRALSSREGHGEMELLRVLLDGREEVQGSPTWREMGGMGWGRSRWRRGDGAPWGPGRFVPLGIAATAVLAITGILRWPSPGEDPATVRSATSGPQLLAPPAGAEVSLPATLVWSRHPEAVEYRVEVMDTAGSPLVEARLAGTDTTWVLGEELGTPGELLPGGPLRWWVQAVLPTGTARASEVKEFKVRR